MAPIDTQPLQAPSAEADLYCGGKYSTGVQMNPSLLIVDDDEEFRTQMKWALGNDYEIFQAGDRASALEVFRAHHPLVVLLDLGLPPLPSSPEEGLTAMAEILAADCLTKIVIISGQSERNVAREAVAAGAYDSFTKPVDMTELQLLLKRCTHVARLEREYREMQQALGVQAIEGFLGTSASMQAVFDSIRKVANTDAPVLILGESGTGKEMTALAIHRRSMRRSGPFVAINCSAIPETLIESELFGHEKGAFTGAHVQRQGRVEMANAGTLFLDEVGEIPPIVQVKLLRFLQEQQITRVGGREEIQVNTRVLAATNVDLHAALKAGTFREDLFYRLAVVQIHLPPLRDREDDVIVQAHYFMKQFGEENGKSGLSFSQDALRALRRHTWPGNVRELQNCVRRAVIMGNGKRLTAADMGLSGTPGTPSTSLREARLKLERGMVRDALKRHQGQITAAAADLGISRPTFYELMAKLGIERPE